MVTSWLIVGESWVPIGWWGFCRDSSGPNFGASEVSNGEVGVKKRVLAWCPPAGQQQAQDCVGGYRQHWGQIPCGSHVE